MPVQGDLPAPASGDIAVPGRDGPSAVPAPGSPSLSESAGATGSLAPTTAAPRFCRDCGTAWDPAWVSCPVCTAEADRRASLAQGKPRGRPLASGLALYFAVLAISVAGIIAVLSGASLVGAELVLTAVATVLVFVWCAGSWEAVRPGLRTPASPRWYGAALAMGIMTFLVASAAMQGLHWLFSVPVLSYSKPFLHAGYGWRMVVLVVCVQPAVIEELAFRGVVLSGMQQVLSGRDAIMVSALLFMTMHLSVPSFPHLLLIGLGPGYLRVWTGSLYPGMLMHFIHNLLCVMAEGVLR